MWPAFWMLGTDIDPVGWPACGEIDVIEHVGSDPTAVHGTVHGPGYAGVGHGVGHRFDTRSRLSDDVHTYAVAWSAAFISWQLDGHEYFRVAAADVPGPWPFDKAFFLMINLAIGGRWPGNEPDASTLPAEMLIDWIRVDGSEVQESPASRPTCRNVTPPGGPHLRSRRPRPPASPRPLGLPRTPSSPTPAV